MFYPIWYIFASFDAISVPFIIVFTLIVYEVDGSSSWNTTLLSALSSVYNAVVETVGLSKDVDDCTIWRSPSVSVDVVLAPSSSFIENDDEPVNGE